jgi:hypothetical protein
MKQTIVILIALLSITGITAQTTNTDYFINESSTRSSLNPAFRPSQGYIGTPANVYVDIKTNTLNLDHLLFPKDGDLLTFMHPDVTADEFLKNITKNNYLAADAKWQILSAGWYKGDGFWTVDLGLRAHADVNIPKSVFELMKIGFSDNEDDVFNYDLKNIGGSISSFVETGVGYSRPLLDNSLMLGAKAKILVGLFDADINIDRMNLSYGNSQWTAKAKASLNGSAVGLKPKYKTRIKTAKDGNSEEELLFDGIDFDDFSISGWGLGADLGAVYDFKQIAEGITDPIFSNILSRVKASLAFTDIGFISLSGSNSMHLVSPDIEVEISPNNYAIGADDGSQSLENHLNDVMEDMGEALNFKETKAGKGRTTALHTNMNIGLEYEAWANNLSVGLLSTTQFGEYHTTTEFTVSANYNPNRDWFAASLSYSFVHSLFDTFGLAIHLAPQKGVNFFLASDYVIPHINSSFLPVTAKGVNFQVGLSVPIGARR